MTAPIVGPAARVDALTVDAAVGRFLRALSMNPADMTPGALAAIRTGFRQLSLKRADRRLPLVIESVQEAIAEAQTQCSDWSPEDFVMFCWWIKGSCDWDAMRGWEARLLDEVADHLPRRALGGAVFFTWKAVTNPQEFLATERWRELFQQAGYVEDLKVMDRSGDSHLILYRGANWETRANWSWAGTYLTAEHFRRVHAGAGGTVWVALVPRGNVLARNRERTHLPLSDEYVVDTMRKDKPGFTIPIRPLDMWVRDRHWPGCRKETSGRCADCGAVAKHAGLQSSAIEGESITEAFLMRDKRRQHLASLARPDALTAMSLGMSGTAVAFQEGA